MLILPPGHAQAVRARRSLSVREKRMVTGVILAVAVLIAVVLISIGSTGRSSGAGCIDLKLAYVTGGEEFYKCGAAARATCASAGTQGSSGEVAEEIAAACRKAGLPVRENR